MRAPLLAVLLGLAACGPRQVDVRTAPASATQISVHVTNNLTQAVNVYYNAGGADVFLRQVEAGRQLSIPVSSARPGMEVTLKATTVDGGRTYSKPRVVLNGLYAWAIP